MTTAEWATLEETGELSATGDTSSWVGPTRCLFLRPVRMPAADAKRHFCFAIHAFIYSEKRSRIARWESALQNEVRVLVVDDQAEVAQSIAELLQARGYSTRVAGDGLEAMAALESFDPDCMLLDLNMPNMSGAEVARSVRQRRGRVVVVAVSGRADLHIRSEDLVSVDHWLTKPVNLDAFYKIFPLIER